MKNIIFISVVFSIFFSCSLEKAKYDKIKRDNCSAEYVYRKSDQKYFALIAPAEQKRQPYPWESEDLFDLPKITERHFVCKGKPTNPTIFRKEKNNTKSFSDCEGANYHSLPQVHGKQGVYPVLIDLLNYIQDKLKKRVVITSGYRCPLHNAYCDETGYYKNSKHMMGAAVDFYVQGAEDHPELVIDLIQNFYKERPGYKNSSVFSEFLRSEETHLDVSTPAWYNKEIFIKLYKPNEGRHIDNRHPYPYLSIQVRYDRDLKEQVSFSLDQVLRNYKRW